MKKQLFATVLLASGILCAQNIIRDPDFNKGRLDECAFDANAGTMKRQIVTEDLTWNKCLRVENIKHHINKKTGKKETYISCWIGKEGKGPGFPVEPNTVYEFQFECKCNRVPGVRHVEWSGMDFWKNMKTGKPSMISKPVVSNEWNVVKGSFITSPTAKRAALQIYFNGRDEWKNTVPAGAFFMVDKVRIQKKKSLLASGTAATVTEKKFTRPCLLPETTYSNFVLLKDGTKAKAQTECSCILKDGKFVVDVRCMEPEMSKLAAKITENGANVWRDDCVEIFFNSPDPKRTFNQFAVAAGGGRWMGRGGDEPVKDFDTWTAKVTKGKDSWSVHAEFPLASLGWKKAPASGETVLFFVARNRVPGKEISSLGPVKNGFHSRQDWGIFFPHGVKPWFESAKKKMLKQVEGSSDLTAKVKTWTSSGIPEKDFAKLEFFKASLTAAKLAGRKFVLTLNPITADTEIPFIPATLAEPPEKISCRAAGNDFAWVPLAITNLTDRMEEYRVVVSALEPKTNREKNQLETADGKVFPVDQMSMFRAIRVKDGDEVNHGCRYDPLAPMDVTQTVTVAPKESAPVWIRFNTKDVTPGVYRGVVRVIPLGEIGSAKKKIFSYRDTPFSFEVLPFALADEFVTPHFLFQQAYSKDAFRQMLESQVNTFLVNPWSAGFTFDKEGKLTKKNTSKMESVIQRYQAWAKEFGVEGKLHYCFCYSAYTHFMNILSGKKLKPFTPEWEKGWLTYMKEVDAIRAKYNIPIDRWSIEILDEPKTPVLPELTRAAELAYKANPEVRFMITLAAWELPPAELQKMVPYVYEWCFWGNKFFVMPEYASLVADIRKQKKILTTYVCSTSMRESLQRYFRVLPWAVPCFDLQGCNMYQHTTYQYKDRDWKYAAMGEVALMTGESVVTTIRGECLNAGFGDLRYLAKLREVQKTVKSGSPLAKEIQDFLDRTPRSFVRKAPDNARYFDEAREKMIDLILKAGTGH